MNVGNADDSRCVVEWLLTELERDLEAMQGTASPEGMNLLDMVIDSEKLGTIRRDARSKRTPLTQHGPSSSHAKVSRRDGSQSSDEGFLITALDEAPLEASSARPPLEEPTEQELAERILEEVREHRHCKNACWCPSKYSFVVSKYTSPKPRVVYVSGIKKTRMVDKVQDVFLRSHENVTAFLEL